ncbi:histidine phosphatase family protein [Paenibacillus marinisediminis]
MKNIYLVRHCKAEGQEAEATLTVEGEQQAVELADYFAQLDIDYVVSSPFTRAVETIRPLCERMNLDLQIDERLKERVLSSHHLDEWMDKLRETYHNADLKYEGGESSNEAMRRGMEVIHELLDRHESNAIVVTHGALMSLMIRHYNQAFGFEEWRSLTNPDIYQLQVSDDRSEMKIHRIWT